MSDVKLDEVLVLFELYEKDREAYNRFMEFFEKVYVPSMTKVGASMMAEMRKAATQGFS